MALKLTHIQDSTVASGGSVTKKVAVSTDGANWDYLKVASVTGVWNAFADENYGYAQKSIIILTLDDGSKITFDSQTVSASTQPGWAGGTKAKWQQAKDDIASWL